MQIIAIIIFLATIITVMTEKVHRAVAAVVGALLLILTGVLTVESGFSYVDINTIGVLIGMMLFVAIVKNSGIFEYIAIKAAMKVLSVLVIAIYVVGSFLAFASGLCPYHGKGVRLHVHGVRSVYRSLHPRGLGA